MGSYGRNVEFRIVPETENRLARWATPATGSFVMGQPVQADDVAGVDAIGRQILKAAAAGTPPVKGRCGLAIYEHGDGATWAGVDPMLTTYSDLGTLPNAKAVQVISGPNVKVVFRNTDSTSFAPVFASRNYTSRTIVAGLGATPTVAIGDYLEPATTPSDTNGYWQETATRANAWLVVVNVDIARHEVEAQFLF
jgi:hypothetical protein